MAHHPNADEAPSFEPIRVPIDASATKWAVNRNWNRRGAHVSKASK